jgi:hypothetical protein
VHWDAPKAQSCIVQNFCATGDQTLLSLPGTWEKTFSFQFKHYNLTIHVVNFCKTFCTYSPSILGQDPMVKSLKKFKKTIWASWARNGRFGFGLGPLGVKDDHFLMFDINDSLQRKMIQRTQLGQLSLSVTGFLWCGYWEYGGNSASFTRCRCKYNITRRIFFAAPLWSLLLLSMPFMCRANFIFKYVQIWISSHQVKLDRQIPWWTWQI